VIAGLNVLEDVGLALEIGTELKRICAEFGLPYAFKASFDKANRSSIKSFRGPGLQAGLKILEKVKGELNVPICTDVHEPAQSAPVAAVAEIVQLPAFLCRQTDLVVSMAEATQAAGGVLHVKKAQFLAPWDTKNIVSKIGEVAPDLPRNRQSQLAQMASSSNFIQTQMRPCVMRRVASQLPRHLVY